MVYSKLHLNCYLSLVFRFKTLLKKASLIPRRRWEDNIKMEREELGFGGMDWIGLAQEKDRWQAVVDAVMNVRVP